MTLGGFALLVLNGMGRKRSRRRQAAGGAGQALGWWGRYGDFVALGMVGAGLVGMMLHK